MCLIRNCLKYRENEGCFEKNQAWISKFLLKDIINQCKNDTSCKKSKKHYVEFINSDGGITVDTEKIMMFNNLEEKSTSFVSEPASVMRSLLTIAPFVSGKNHNLLPTKSRSHFSRQIRKRADHRLSGITPHFRSAEA